MKIGGRAAAPAWMSNARARSSCWSLTSGARAPPGFGATPGIAGTPVDEPCAQPVSKAKASAEKTPSIERVIPKELRAASFRSLPEAVIGPSGFLAAQRVCYGVSVAHVHEHRNHRDDARDRRRLNERTVRYGQTGDAARNANLTEVERRETGAPVEELDR